MPDEAAWIRSLVEAARLSTSSGEERPVAGISFQVTYCCKKLLPTTHTRL